MQGKKFFHRHLGVTGESAKPLLKVCGVNHLDELISEVVPSAIRLDKPMTGPSGMSENEYLQYIWSVAQRNKLFRTYIGMGYYGTVTPSVIHRNIFENPSWYTSYTPYQAEISQGRLEALLNYQTMVSDLTGLPIANASLLDESTAAAEAMIMFYNTRSKEKESSGANVFYIDREVFPQTIDVVQTRARFLGIEVLVGDYRSFDWQRPVFGVLVQFPAADGEVRDYRGFVEAAHIQKVPVVVAADLLSLALLTPPGEWGADVVVGSTQRFGVPIGFGGPHAAFFAATEAYKRAIPGRIIGITVDRHGNRALRMALQTREQHIKRERATSNICTAQALLAIMAGMYAVYHGKEGLVEIAENIHHLTVALANNLKELGFPPANKQYFDTLQIPLRDGITTSDVQRIALEHEINLGYIGTDKVTISLDETCTLDNVNAILEVFAIVRTRQFARITGTGRYWAIDEHLRRFSGFLQHEVFRRYRTETEMMRYIKQLERRDISLTDSMISLGSCTMKLNAATEMLPLSWPELNQLHPFVPIDQTEGYQLLMHELGSTLMAATGFEGISFQPNSGASGEYAGLLVIRQYHESRGEGHRHVVLIPSSAHGTNPASAAMAGLKVVVVACDNQGNIDTADLRAKAEKHSVNLAALMVTYPSTHGVFEENINEITTIAHQFGAQVYMDGANMNAQLGLTNPAKIGADVCHLNLHKTFAIPHGGGGPGVGPICVAGHLVEFLPAHPLVATGGVKGIGAISAAPWGSASILVISHAYCRMMGAEGLTLATKTAILNANYMAHRLSDKFDVLYKGSKGRVAHEMIIDCRKFKSAGISETDIAKRLMDYGYHAPTLSFPVHGTLMIEPTESESKEELDRFIEAMFSIYQEIEEVAGGVADAVDNVLKNAPHTMFEVTADDWQHNYPRQKAAFPKDWIRVKKFWPFVGRVDDAYGDRNLLCTCQVTAGRQL